MIIIIYILTREGEELKAPCYASAAAIYNGNLPYVTATYYT